MSAFIARASLIIAIIALGFPRAIFAHAFGQSYVLPVPLWMYLYGAGAALVLSFAVIAYVSADVETASLSSRDIARMVVVKSGISRVFVWILRFLAVILFLLTLASGYIGTDLPLGNSNMTLFWIVFMLGMTYASALFGNVWEGINPIRVIARWYIGASARFRYPQRLGVWPALAVFAIFIWCELIGKTTPLSLSIILSIYAAYTCLGAYLFGIDRWFAKGDFFSVFFSMIAKLSPIAIENGRARLRMPFVGAMETTPSSMSELWFVLFMIASTSFDGFQETLPMLRAYLRTSKVVPSYDLFRTLCFVLAPLLFFAGYMLCMWCVKKITRSGLQLRDLALGFAYTLIPIALAYHVAHYFTLFAVQGQHIIHLISDPFGFGWNMFGTADYRVNVGILQAGTIWHSQVAALLVGHIASVYLAHHAAVMLFKHRKYALLSEIPMLVLMVGYTVLGLWILSQPITTG